MNGLVVAVEAVVEANGRTQEANQQRELVALSLSKARYWKEALDFRQCQDPETIRQYRVCESDPHHYAKPCSFTCHLRFCEDCARREAARLKQRYVPVMEAVAAKPPNGYSLKHIVLTTKYSLVDENGDPRSSEDTHQELREMWQMVSKAFDEYFSVLTEVARHEVKGKPVVSVLAYCLKVRLDDLRRDGKAGWFNRLKTKIAVGQKWYQRMLLKLHFPLSYDNKTLINITAQNR